MIRILKPLDEFAKPEALLFDLDGTLYRGHEPVPGAGRLIAGLQSRGMLSLFVTNNSTRTPGEVAEHLEMMGVEAPVERIVTSAMAAADYARSNYPGAAAYAIGEKGLKEALQDAGLRLVGNGETADVVVQGLDRQLTYDRLTEAVRHLLGGAAFVQTNPDRLLPVDGGFLPGAGSIGATLQAAVGIEPIVIGKPSRILMDYSLRISGTSPAGTWVIGDNPYTDLAAARNAGCPAILVLTGLCDADNWESHCAKAEAYPDVVCTGPEQLEQFLHDRI
ncbi:HAD-IIA family hydrolase [Cohnella sp. LGH]|uniref:HAD-IIA family hydrolase n=1 Tax=Cohnella sp. LGH TaxID=1619153 RepID=UPI001FFE0E3B|nr:HAD-IIA family hydrolase [Cohnella sp. LGH]